MPDRRFRKVRIEGEATLVDRATGRKLGTIRGLELELDEDFLHSLASPPSLSGEGGHGPEGPSSSAVSAGAQTTLDGSAPSREDERARARRELSEAIDDVWDEYVRVMEPRRKEAGDEERRIIREALKVATADECKAAIRGCKASAFHMGDNDRRKKYNALSQILKGKRGGKTTREQIDMFLEIAARSGVQSRVTSADPARVRQAKRDVLDAYEFPGDENVVARGEESASWLAAQGFKIEYEESGRPIFRVDDSAA